MYVNYETGEGGRGCGRGVTGEEDRWTSFEVLCTLTMKPGREEGDVGEGLQVRRIDGRVLKFCVR